MADLHVNQPVPSPRPSTATPSSTSTPNGGIFISASRVQAAYTSDEFFNPNCRGVRLYVANDAAGGSTVTVKIQVRAPISNVWIDLAGAATTALGSTTGSMLTVYPVAANTDVANVLVSNILGPCWRVVMTIGVATGTSSVSADYLL